MVRASGSSPRARGTAASPCDQRNRTRFIPAGAGNGFVRSLARARFTVHPRGRGERESRVTTIGTLPGSSPRARGTARPAPRAPGRRRFIPAGAGNGAGLRLAAPGCPVHPRGRGERTNQRWRPSRRRGSSPRARGTAPRPGQTPQRERFIPAGAGNGVLPRLGLTPESVHPRGRGERSQARADRHEVTGSSPRARGTVPLIVELFVMTRFIPAGAGNGLQISACC